MIEVKFYNNEDNKELKYVVIMARYNDSWIFCKNKNNDTYEIPGGKIINGENCLDAAKRELMEETGAITFDIEKVSIYSVVNNSEETYGALFYADIKTIGELKHEIKKIIFVDYLPYDLTYPQIQPKLYRYVCDNVSFLPKTEKKRMLAGKLYFQPVNELIEMHKRALRLCQEYNFSKWDQFERRQEIIKELFGTVKGDFYLEPTIKCDYGCNIHIGNHFYCNFDTIFLDVCPIYFGDNIYIAPSCSFFTAGHPIDSVIRAEALEFGKEIRVGSNVWFGGHTIVNPGVTIGSNVVIGSGSVVTKDIPDNVVAAGNPCRVLRKITEDDKIKWEKEKIEYLNSKVDSNL